MGVAFFRDGVTPKDSPTIRCHSPAPFRSIFGGIVFGFELGKFVKSGCYVKVFALEAW